MLTELRSSAYKIKQLFQRSWTRNDNAYGEQCSMQRWSTGFYDALSKKLQQRSAVCGVPSRSLHHQLSVSSALAPRPSLRVRSERTSSAVLGDAFSGLEISETPTTPFGIKAFQNASSRPLSEYISDRPTDQYLVESVSTDEALEVGALIARVNEGLAVAPPKLCNLGTGGVYFFMSASNEPLAVFKPTDEEPRGINNPKGYEQNGESESLRDGIRSGEGAVRERAAFLLDHQRVSGVPTTTMVTMTSKDDPDFEKTGSLQQYIPFDYDAEECGTGLFSVEDVHRVCLADFRYVNTDRNGQNLLVTRQEDGATKLTPIDHGYCFPDTLPDLSFEWTYWPQAKQPFTPALLKQDFPRINYKNDCDYRFIEELDPEADLGILRRHDVVLRPECERVFLFVNYFLKWAVQKAYCTPRSIALMLSGSNSNALENSFNLANSLSHGIMTESQVYQALDHFADGLLKKMTRTMTM